MGGEGASRPGSTAAVWTETVGVVVASAVPGLLLLPLVVPAARRLDVAPGLVEYCGVSFVSGLWVLLLLAVVVARRERTDLAGLLRRSWRSRPPAPRAIPLAVGAAIAAIVSFSPLRLWLIDRGWDLLAGPSWSINSPAANRGTFGFDVSFVVVLFQLAVRIPLTVLVEETLFRGWVQDRHGPWVAAVAFAAYHFTQWWTIPALLPFGLALALLRAATGSLRPGAGIHGFGNAVYAVQAWLH